MGFHPELIVVLVIALLVFGPKKLPEMGSAIGKSIQQFKKGMEDIQTSSHDEPKAGAADIEREALEREIARKKASLAAQEAIPAAFSEHDIIHHESPTHEVPHAETVINPLPTVTPVD